MRFIPDAKRSGINIMLGAGLALALFIMHSLAYAQANPPRIISADLGTTQILRALGLAEHVVAIDLTSSREEAFHHLPTIGYHRQLSPEGLLSLNADVLIGSSHMGPERTLDVLRETHVEVIQQETPENVSMLTNNIFQIAKAFHLEEEGLSVAEKLVEKDTRLSAMTVKHTTAVFLLDMGGANGSMAGMGTSGDAFIKLLGMTNLAQFNAYRETSAETLLAMQPDLIITASRNISSDQSHQRDKRLQRKVGSVYGIPAINIDASSLVAGISVAAIDEALRVKALLSHVIAEAH